MEQLAHESQRKEKEAADSLRLSEQARVLVENSLATSQRRQDVEVTEKERVASAAWDAMGTVFDALTSVGVLAPKPDHPPAVAMKTLTWIQEGVSHMGDAARGFGTVCTQTAYHLVFRA